MGQESKQTLHCRYLAGIFAHPLFRFASSPVFKAKQLPAWRDLVTIAWFPEMRAKVAKRIFVRRVAYRHLGQCFLYFCSATNSGFQNPCYYLRSSWL